MFGRYICTGAVAAAMLCATGMLAGPSAAAPAETHSVAVSFGDLNLASDAGRAALQHRIAHAIEGVCGPAHGRTAEESQAYAACRKTAEARAAMQFDAAVAQAHDSQKVASRPDGAISVQ